MPSELSDQNFLSDELCANTPTEIRVRGIDVVLTKLRLEPGDVLVVQATCPVDQQSRVKFEQAVRESFGVQCVLLSPGVELKAVLSISPVCQGIAADERRKATEASYEAIRKALSPRQEAAKCP